MQRLSEADIVNVADAEHITCPICSEIFLDPVFGPCQHVYCRACMVAALQARAECPSCRKRVRVRDLKVHRFTLDLMDRTEVRCSHKCGWQGRLDYRPGHMNEACPVVLRRQVDEAKEAVQTIQQELADCRREAMAAEQRMQQELAASQKMAPLRQREAELEQARAESRRVQQQFADCQREARRNKEKLQKELANSRSEEALHVQRAAELEQVNAAFRLTQQELAECKRKACGTQEQLSRSWKQVASLMSRQAELEKVGCICCRPVFLLCLVCLLWAGFFCCSKAMNQELQQGWDNCQKEVEALHQEREATSQELQQGWDNCQKEVEVLHKEREATSQELQQGWDNCQKEVEVLHKEREATSQELQQGWDNCQKEVEVLHKEREDNAPRANGLLSAVVSLLVLGLLGCCPTIQAQAPEARIQEIPES